jgi:xanthine dehydrogenase molybdenum-binding subunit
MPLGQVTINKIINVQDNGRLINPKLVEQQVHGGMAQSIGFGLYEELQIDPKTGRVLNPTLLDYKVPTMMDVPDLEAQFVETDDPTGPYGNKAVGETPVISPAAAIRDAILDATGVKFYQEPMTPQRLFEGFKREGLI